MGAALLGYAALGLGCNDAADQVPDAGGAIDAGRPDGALPDAAMDGGPDAEADGGPGDGGTDASQPTVMTATVTLTCPTSVGLDVSVDADLRITALAAVVAETAVPFRVRLRATQKALPVTIPTELKKAEWALSVAGAQPATISHTETFDPPLEINLGDDNALEGGTESTDLTPGAGASAVELALTSVDLLAETGGVEIPVSCPVEAPQALVFPVAP